MNTTLRLFIPFLLTFFLATAMSAQVVTKRVVIANGGQFGNPAEDAHLIIYNPADGLSSTPDTVHTSSIQDLLIDGHYAFLAAQDSIVRYDIAAGTRVASEAFGAPSTIHMELYGDYLLVGNWYAAGSGNLRIFDKNTLAFVDSVPEISLGAKDFVVVGDTAFISQNYSTSAFTDSAGFIAVVDLTDFSYVRDITFSNQDEDLGRLVVQDNVIYGLNASSNSITAYDIQNGSSMTMAAGVDIQVRGNGSQTAWMGDTLYFPYNNRIGSWDLASFSAIDTNVVDTISTAFAYDTLNQQFYLTQTDFFSYLRGGIWNRDGSKAGSLPVGSSPEAIQVMYNTYPEATADTFAVTGADPLELAVLDNDMDADGDMLTLSIVTAPKNGMASVVGDKISITGAMGPDSLQYAAVDPWGDADTTWVLLTAATPIEGLLTTGVEAFPNPANQQLWIQWEHNISARVILRDLSGRSLVQMDIAGEGVFSLPITGIASGLYLLSVESAEGNWVKKITKE